MATQTLPVIGACFLVAAHLYLKEHIRSWPYAGTGAIVLGIIRLAL